MKLNQSPSSPNHAVLDTVARTIQQQLLPQLESVEESPHGVIDGLATCATGALLVRGYEGSLVGLSRALVLETYRVKGWPEPSAAEVRAVLTACVKDRAQMAMACIAAKATQLRSTTP